MNYNDWAKEIHENAVKHGWYDKPISQYEYAAQFHSEVSEAFEEYRNEMPDVYWICDVTGEICAPASEYDCECYAREWECTHRKPEPHGIAIELIDLVLRVLDCAGAMGFDVDNGAGEYYIIMPEIDGFAHMIYLLHDLVKDVAYDGLKLFNVAAIRSIINTIEDYCKSKHLDFETLLRLKHEYNKTRPYRHGGKRC